MLSSSPSPRPRPSCPRLSVTRPSRWAASRLSRLACVVAVSVSVAAVGCGDHTANDPPIIDSVDAPVAVREANGSYTIPITLLYHDNDGEAVTHVRYVLASKTPTPRSGASRQGQRGDDRQPEEEPMDVEGTVEVPAPNPARQSTEVILVIRAPESGKRGSPRSESGPRNRPRTLFLTLRDIRGAESRPRATEITLD